MQVIGKSGVTFLNDSYNANPDSTVAALSALKEMTVSGKKYIVLGDMLELGSSSQKWHRQIIEQALHVKPAGVFVMGEEMRQAAERIAGARVYDAHSAIVSALKERLHPGDLVLLKGSRSMQMEKILEEIN